MSGFAGRMQAAEKFEIELVDRLNGTGWRAFRFGQSQLPEECRSLLIKYEDGSGRPCLIRWMPDIITFRTYPGGRVFTALIDAKVCPREMPNYSVEMSAVETSEIFTDRLYTPTFFVFDDGKVLTPREVRQRGKPGPSSNNGSGTPYLLVEKRFGLPFVRYFPPVPKAA